MMIRHRTLSIWSRNRGPIHMRSGDTMASGAMPPSSKRKPVLVLEMLGHFAIRLIDCSIEITGRKSRALIAYLALADRGIETRERLVGLLWSEVEEDRARASLRQSIYEIREI